MSKLRAWASDVKELLPCCGAFLGTVLVCVGMVFYGDRLFRPEPPIVKPEDEPWVKRALAENYHLRAEAFELRAKLAEVEAENLKLWVELKVSADLDALRRAAAPRAMVAPPEPPPSDLIPATNVPTQPVP